MDKISKIRKLLEEIQIENRLKITEELFYDLEHAGIIYVDQENWSYAPGKAQKLSKKAEKWDLFQASFKEHDCKYIPICQLPIELEAIRVLVHKQEDKINCDPGAYIDSDRAFDELVPLLRNVSEILNKSINNQEKRLKQ